MSNGTTNGALDDKRRLTVTQILKSPVLNPAGDEVGRVEDLIVK
jgi:sporulation protein YlmC with PRC-barrel domain